LHCHPSLRYTSLAATIITPGGKAITASTRQAIFISRWQIQGVRLLQEQGGGTAMPRMLYIQGDAPDPVLPPDVILDLVRQHGQAAQTVVAVDESGGEARTYAVDDAIIVKVQRPQQLRPYTSLAREVVFLEALAGVPGVNVPRVLGHGQQGRDIEYTVMTHMPGDAWVRQPPTGHMRYESLRDLGAMIARMHRIPQEPMLASKLFPGDHTLADFHLRLNRAFSEAIDLIDRHQRPWTLPLSPEHVAVTALAMLPNTGDLVALHSNPGPEHVFVDPTGGALVGIIDFGDAYFSHPAFDLRRWLLPDEREAVLAGYASVTPTSADFLTIWKAVALLTHMLTIAAGSARTAAALEDIPSLLP
jgi:hygromycin-B 7''-O-kinase